MQSSYLYSRCKGLARISIIWSRPQSDCNRVQATNQYALPVLRYLMWTQHWSPSELRDVDRAARKIIVENDSKQPARLTSLLYLPREKGGRGLQSNTSIRSIKSNRYLNCIRIENRLWKQLENLKNTPWHQATSRL